MPRKRVVTSVSVDPAVFEQGRDEGLNFSKVLEQGIIDQLRPDKQINRLEGEVLFHEREIVKLKEEINVLKQIENKHVDYIMSELLDRVEPYYMEHGILPERVLTSFSTRLRKNRSELEEEVLCLLRS